MKQGEMRHQLEFQKCIESTINASIEMLRYEMQYGLPEDRFACQVGIKGLGDVKKAFRKAINEGKVDPQRPGTTGPRKLRLVKENN